jgi:hypothetical protein
MKANTHVDTDRGLGYGSTQEKRGRRKGTAVRCAASHRQYLNECQCVMSQAAETESSSVLGGGKIVGRFRVASQTSTVWHAPAHVSGLLLMIRKADGTVTTSRLLVHWILCAAARRVQARKPHPSAAAGSGARSFVSLRHAASFALHSSITATCSVDRIRLCISPGSFTISNNSSGFSPSS